MYVWQFCVNRTVNGECNRIFIYQDMLAKMGTSCCLWEGGVFLAIIWGLYHHIITISSPYKHYIITKCHPNWDGGSRIWVDKSTSVMS
jgi:hypothetical protein